ncbi:MAG: hypothetical protein IT355_04650 [Gemmatimonadaceae bacterium]|nr:hypothetical protein [Gemmatimonadaceae bacterium]
MESKSTARTRPSHRRLTAAVGCWMVAGVLLVACGKDTPAPRVDSVAPSVAPAATPVDSVAPKVDTRWSGSAGPALYLPGENGVAQVILPPVLDDSVPKPSSVTLPAGAAPASVDLFAPTGRVATVSLGEYAASAQPEAVEGCDAWPVVPLRGDAAGVAPASWKVALRAGVADPVPTDSIGAMSRGDSAQLVVAINKAAALLPLDPAGVLRRVPFGVTRAYRLKLGTDIDAVVAVVERRLNVEASPRVERTVIVLEKSPGMRAYAAVWRDTQYAEEDDLIAVELLAVVTFRATGIPAVFLGQDFGDGSRVQMLQRTAGGIWSLRWESAYTGC